MPKSDQEPKPPQTEDTAPPSIPNGNTTSSDRIVVVAENRADWEAMANVVRHLAIQLDLSVELFAVESVSKPKVDQPNSRKKSKKQSNANSGGATRPTGTEQLPIWAAAIAKSPEFSWVANARALPCDLKQAAYLVHQTSGIHSVIGRYSEQESSDWINKLFLRLMIRCVWLRPPTDWQRTIAVQYKNSPNSNARLAVQLKKQSEKRQKQKEKERKKQETLSEQNSDAETIDFVTSHSYSDLKLSWVASSQIEDDREGENDEPVEPEEFSGSPAVLPELLIVNESQSLVLEFSNKDLNSSDLENALLLFPVRAANRSSLPFAIARRLREKLGQAGFALIKEPSPNWRTWIAHFETWIDIHFPQMERDARKKLSGDLDHFSSLNGEFLLLVSASAFLAAFGLIMNSASVIIGAMLIAPLMTPIQGIGLALTNGNRELFLRAIKTVSIGFLFALFSGMVMGLWLRATTLDAEVYAGYMTDEIWARCKPSVLDFAVGFVGGAAAAFARTRSHLADALAGAAIAAALVPPIATAGLQIAMWPPVEPPDHVLPIIGPAAVFLANVLTITIGTSIILWLRGIRTFHEHGSQDRWSNRMYILLAILAALFAVAIMRVAQSL